MIELLGGKEKLKEYAIAVIRDRLNKLTIQTSKTDLEDILGIRIDVINDLENNWDKWKVNVIMGALGITLSEVLPDLSGIDKNTKKTFINDGFLVPMFVEGESSTINQETLDELSVKIRLLDMLFE
jgi:hypothetical protein